MLSSAFVVGAAVAMLQVLPTTVIPTIAGRASPGRGGPILVYGIEAIT